MSSGHRLVRVAPWTAPASYGNTAVMLKSRALLVASAVTAAVTFSLPAAATVNLAAFGGMGLTGEDGEDLMGFGYGARAGMTFILPVYVGLAATLHQGTSDDEEGSQANRMNTYGAEAGVQLSLGSLGVRPYVMGGLADVDTTRDVDGGFLTPYFGFGLAPHWSFVQTPVLDLFIGLDVRYVQTTTLIDNGDSETPAAGIPVYLHVGANLL